MVWWGGGGGRGVVGGGEGTWGGNVVWCGGDMLRMQLYNIFHPRVRVHEDTKWV